MNLIILLMLILFVLVGVSFLSLLEQKGLSYIQLRKGPNKAGIVGLLQPFCDAIKLFSKEYMIPTYSNYLIYYFAPIFSLLISLMLWLSFPFIYKFLSMNLGIMFLLSGMSLGVYSIMLSGWSSNSNYSLLGGLRSIAQTLSYEVCLILILLSYLFLVMSLSLYSFFNFQKYFDFFFLNVPISFVLFIICLAETNRSPFDFAEGESELVSGFNTEYSGGKFALIFMAEYSMILLMSSLFCLFMLGSNIFMFMFFLKIVFLSFVYIWVRGSFPRFRYDLLMYLTWKKYLPISLNYLFFFIMMKFFILSFLL